MLTSGAAGLLLEEGRLELDAEIQRYVPELPEKPSRVTLRQMMGHLAGMRTDGGDEGPLFTPHCERPSKRCSSLQSGPCCSSQERSTAIRATGGSW